MENILYINGSTFRYGEDEFELDDLYSVEMFEYLNGIVDQFNSNNYFDNIIYSKYIQKVYAIVHFIKRNNINEISIQSSNTELVAFIKDAANVCAVNVCPQKIGRRTFRWFAYWLGICRLLASSAYLLLLQVKQKKESRILDLNKDLCVIRTEQTKKKISVTSDREMFFEDKIGQGSLYSSISRRKRIVMVFQATWDGLKQFSSLSEYLKTHNLENVTLDCMKFFSIRLAHVALYEKLLDYLMSFSWKGKFITGNNLDSYALVEEKVAHKHGMFIVCIPHGLEYGFKFPHCFTGDLFYTTSAYAAEYLNGLYNTEKFCFDDSIANEMYQVKSECLRKEKKVVYFSEPREPEINISIISKVLPYMEAVGIRLYIKHHPKDNLADYEMFKDHLYVIDDLNEALVGNVCIARKSTTLLEAIYNESVSAAILTCEKDKAIFYTFPSLQDTKIKVFESIEDLASWIIKQLS